MDADYERLYHHLETEHWWFKSRRQALRQRVSQCDRSARILDIGCSSGILLQALRDDGFDAGNLYGIDISGLAIRSCHEAGLIHCSQMDAQDITLPPHTFDVLIASDCLEHLEDETAALNSWRQQLAPNGLLIIYVPAFQLLWSHHDTANHHFRRYNLAELVKSVNNAGFCVVESGYWNSLLFVPILSLRLIGRLLPKRTPVEHGDLSMPPRFINTLLLLLLRIERLLPGFPFGVSAWCVGTNYDDGQR